MFARFALAFVIALLAAGCVSMKETRTTNPDGSVTIERSVKGVVSGSGGYYGYGGYGYLPRRVYDPRNRTLEIQEHPGNESVMFKKYDVQGNLIQMVPICPRTGNAPIAGKC